jgi:hypothetical protein
MSLFWLTLLMPEVLALYWLCLAAGAAALAVFLVGGLGALLGFRADSRDLVLEHTTDVDFLDDVGREVDVRIRRVFRTRAAGVGTYVWVFGVDSSKTIQAAAVSPGAIADRRQRSGVLEIVQQFPTPLQRLRRSEIEFRGRFLDAFRNPDEEYWDTAISYPTRHLRVRISYSSGRKPDLNSIRVIEQVNQSAFDLVGDSLKITSGTDGRHHVEVNLSHPRQFAAYRIVWRWEQVALGPDGATV